MVLAETTELRQILARCGSREEKAETLEAYIEKDRYAADVCHNRTTYSKLIEPITEKKDWLLRCDRIDAEYDSYVRKVIGSMNLIGLTELDPELYTTEGRSVREEGRKRAVSGAGAMLMGVGAVVSYVMASKGADIGTSLAKNGVAAIIVTAVLGKLTAVMDRARIELEMKYLERQAEMNDQYLRKEYFLTYNGR